MGSRPSLDEIAVVLAHLADRIAASRGRRAEPSTEISLNRAIEELRRHIPGLYVPFDAGAAQQLATMSAEAFHQGRVRAGFARALRGLSFSPHDPELWYLAAQGSLQMGMVDVPVKMLLYCLWVNPAHPGASRDLEAIKAYGQTAIDERPNKMNWPEYDDEDREERLEEEHED